MRVVELQVASCELRVASGQFPVPMENSVNSSPGGGGRVLPYVAYKGMCRWTGGMVFGLFCVCPKQGVYFVICSKLGPEGK